MLFYVKAKTKQKIIFLAITTSYYFTQLYSMHVNVYLMILVGSIN